MVTSNELDLEQVFSWPHLDRSRMLVDIESRSPSRYTWMCPTFGTTFRVVPGTSFPPIRTI